MLDRLRLYVMGIKFECFTLILLKRTEHKRAGTIENRIFGTFVVVGMCSLNDAVLEKKVH